MIFSTSITKIKTRGYLFDIYHIKDKVILWIKGKGKGKKDGNIKRYEYLWPSSIYVVADKISDLEFLLSNETILSFIKDYGFEYKFEYSSDRNKKQVLKLILNDSSQVDTLAKYIESLCKRFDHYRLYNVDVLPEQALLYENDVYPLGLYSIKERPNNLNVELLNENE